MSSATKMTPEVQLKKIRRLESNMICPNCGVRAPVGLGFGNVCVKFSTFVCDLCKTSHQAISHRVKSISMSNWTMDEVNLLTSEYNGGNENAIKIWLENAPAFGGKYPGGSRPKEGDRIEVYKKFVIDCYEHGKFKGSTLPDPVIKSENTLSMRHQKNVNEVVKVSCDNNLPLHKPNDGSTKDNGNDFLYFDNFGEGLDVFRRNSSNTQVNYPYNSNNNSFDLFPPIGDVFADFGATHSSGFLSNSVVADRSGGVINKGKYDPFGFDGFDSSATTVISGGSNPNNHSTSSSSLVDDPFNAQNVDFGAFVSENKPLNITITTPVTEKSFDPFDNNLLLPINWSNTSNTPVVQQDKSVVVSNTSMPSFGIPFTDAMSSNNMPNMPMISGAMSYNNNMPMMSGAMNNNNMPMMYEATNNNNIPMMSGAMRNNHMPMMSGAMNNYNMPMISGAMSNNPSDNYPNTGYYNTMNTSINKNYTNNTMNYSNNSTMNNCINNNSNNFGMNNMYNKNIPQYNNSMAAINRGVTIGNINAYPQNISFNSNPVNNISSAFNNVNTNHGSVTSTTHTSSFDFLQQAIKQQIQQSSSYSNNSSTSIKDK